MQASITELEEHRAALTGHCYRMLGSAVDADDAVQESMVRAWRGLDRFDGRASVRTWLYRIATNVCLDALADRARRALPLEEGPAGSVEDAATMVQRPRTHWLEPLATARAVPENGDPAELLMLRQSLRLAFVAALQHLPPKPRAALLLTEVLGWSAAEVAETLDTSVAAVNSALQRARERVTTRELREPESLSPAQTRTIERYVEAFERHDVDTLASLLREEATFSMPPYTLWLRGPASVHAWLSGPGTGCRGSRLVPTSACGSPAFGQYRKNPEGGHRAWALIVLELSGESIADWTSFLDTETFFPRFGLPLDLPA
jgi:RNA polymerase sigma-70 factor (ECF subfamily)